ncbi:MAG: hypothetical protein KF760_25880 [Candidatus Eremiobacteraeota bacterium]|nr:hypothetical protein [Candidatus Eremiobacteraeota bacterium]MCW5869106.1 hypothetical protein [Candidatus Eremiobacteraeota bacterium]
MRRGIAPILFAVNFLLTIPYWSTYFGMDDEAVTVLGASRLLRGEWPYYHWDTRHTPGSYLLSALYFWIFGSDRLATRSLMALVASLSGLFIYSIGKRSLPGRLSYLPWLMWCCGGLTAFPILNYHWWGTLFTLSTFYLVVRWRSERRFAPWAGVGAALALWTLQSDGLASVLMIGLVWLRYRPAGLARLLLAWVAASLVLWLPFLPAAGQVVQQNLLDLTQHLRYNHYAYRWAPWLALAKVAANPEIPWLARCAIVSNFWLETQTYGLYYIIILASLVVFEKKRRPELATLAWCALAWAAAAGNRQTVAYLAFSCPAVFLCQTGLLSLLPRAAWLAVGWGSLEVLGMTSRVVFLENYWTYAISTRRGVYRTQSEEQARAIGQAHRWCDSYLPPGSTVLSYPYFCSLYTTEDLRNPLRVPVLTPFLYDQQELERARGLLKEKQVEYLLYLGLTPEAMQESYGIPAELYRRRADQELQAITADYQLLDGGGPLRLYRRRKPVPAPRG